MIYQWRLSCQKDCVFVSAFTYFIYLFIYFGVGGKKWRSAALPVATGGYSRAGVSLVRMESCSISSRDKKGAFEAISFHRNCFLENLQNEHACKQTRSAYRLLDLRQREIFDCSLNESITEMRPF